MALFIRDPEHYHYSEFRIDRRRGPEWHCTDTALFGAYYGQFFRHTEEDFCDGSRFFEANDEHDLDWCDASLRKTLAKAYIDPDGGFFGVKAHAALSDFGLNRSFHELDKQGWVRVAEISTGLPMPVYWKKYTGAPTREQRRVMEKIGLDLKLPEVKPNPAITYESVFGTKETEAMQRMRRDMAEKLSGKYRELTPDEARQRISELTAQLSISPHLANGPSW